MTSLNLDLVQMKFAETFNGDIVLVEKDVGLSTSLLRINLRKMIWQRQALLLHLEVAPCVEIIFGVIVVVESSAPFFM